MGKAMSNCHRRSSGVRVVTRTGWQTDLVEVLLSTNFCDLGALKMRNCKEYIYKYTYDVTYSIFCSLFVIVVIIPKLNGVRRSSFGRPIRSQPMAHVFSHATEWSLYYQRPKSRDRLLSVKYIAIGSFFYKSIYVFRRRPFWTLRPPWWWWRKG